jgi:hypothetical protein
MSDSTQFIPVEVPWRIAKNYAQDIVILIAWAAAGDVTRVVTYGRTSAQKSIAADAGEKAARALGPDPEAASLQGSFGVREQAEVLAALEESVKLQSHYAALLNQYDGGERIAFANAAAWIERLREGTRPGLSRDASTLPGPGRDGH